MRAPAVLILSVHCFWLAVTGPAGLTPAGAIGCRTACMCWTSMMVLCCRGGLPVPRTLPLLLPLRLRGGAPRSMASTTGPAESIPRGRGLPRWGAGQQDNVKRLFVDPQCGRDDGGDGSADKPYASIFAAVAHAVSSHKAAEILLAPRREYSGPRNRRISVALAPGQHLSFAATGEGAVLDCGGTGFLLNVTSGGRGAELRLAGLTLQNGKSGLLVGGSVTVRARACILHNFSSSAIRVSQRARLDLDRCCFHNNLLNIPERHAGSARGAVSLWERMGAALAARGRVRLRITDCNFRGNGGDGCVAGGAVALGTQHRKALPGQLSFVGCEFAGNVAGDAGGALALFNSSCVNLTNCVFRNNTAWGLCRGGGALYTQALSAPRGGISWVYGCLFAGNRCPDNSDPPGGLTGGGGIAQVGHGTLSTRYTRQRDRWMDRWVDA